MEAKEHREKLFRHLDGVLERVEKKAINKNTRNGDALSWNRIIIQAVNAYGRILNMEELEQRIETLEEKLKKGVLIPNE
jgi:hypothetical protein